MERIETVLLATFAPTHLEIHNESHMHSAGQESHFKVVVVSESFEGKPSFFRRCAILFLTRLILNPFRKPLLERHRAINDALASEFAAGLHALSIGKATTPSQWTGQVFSSPACLGGSKHDKK